MPFAREILADTQLVRQVPAALPVRLPRAAATARDPGKVAFVHQITHELRTPLCLVRGYAEMLEEDQIGALTDTQRRYVELILAGAARIERLVDDLLAFARMDTRTFTLAPGLVDVAHQAQGALDAFMPLARLRGVTLGLHAAGPVMAVLDPHRLGQVLLNLIGNAIEFTPEGGRVTVTVEADDEHLTASVRDTGIGMDEDQRARVFDRHYSADPGMTRRLGGMGLGLGISKALVEGMSGTIEVESRPGVGSVFRVRLPRQMPVAIP